MRGADMRASIQRLNGVRHERHLYLVPLRRVPLVRHVPARRTLHLVDIENLVGGTERSCMAIRQACSAYREAATVQRGDHAIVGAGPKLIVSAGLAWPEARLALGFGVDGADHALLRSIADLEWVASHYDRMVLGSGDGIFADALGSLRRLGIAVGVVAPVGRISARLRRHAHFVQTFDCEDDARGVA
jgi:hypothetical protein